MDVMTPCRKLLEDTVECHLTPEYKDDSSDTSTALVAPMSYPNKNPPHAGNKKIKKAASLL
jgi:hypothetical protein